MWAPEGILGAKEAGDGRLLRLWRLVGGELSHPLRPRLPRFQARDAAARGVFPPFRSAVLLTHSGCLRSTCLPVCLGRAVPRLLQPELGSVSSVPGHPVQWQPPSFAWTVLFPLPKFLRLEPIWGTRPRLLRPPPPPWDDSRLGQSSEKRALPLCCCGLRQAAGETGSE